jgi:hypothetical protein
MVEGEDREGKCEEYIIPRRLPETHQSVDAIEILEAFKRIPNE